MLADRLLKEVFSFDLSQAKLPKGIQVLDPFNGENSSRSGISWSSSTGNSIRMSVHAC